MSSAEGSPDEGDEQRRPDPGSPPAEEVTDPALAAEVDDPGASNVPTGAETGPDDGVAAADQGPIPGAGAPGELSSDQTPSQGAERGETVAAESVGDVAGGDAGSPESGPTADARPAPEATPDPEGTAAPEAPEATPAPGTAPVDTAQTDPGEGSAAAVVSEQPSPSPSAALSQGAAVQRATEEKVAQAVAARESAVAQAEPAPGESDEARQRLIDTLQRVLGDAVVGSHLAAGVDTWVRVRVDAWRHACEVCRDELGLTYFCYLSAIDWLPSPYGRSEDPPAVDAPEGGEAASGDTGASVAETGVAADEVEHGYAGGESRFQLLARLVSPTTSMGLTLKGDLDEAQPVAPSVREIFPGADWHEREVWEMYGVDFTGHPNLAHLYLPGGFEGRPLRKDFPLLAREVKPWPGLVDVEAMPGEGDGA
ncbi:MAG: NADH-quinone oxidoreductase subunit C [Actinobacteria bacterium]|nr:NADH-quinone oxidoreductase subunit C [Actinomycetota bacterium]